MTHASEKLTVAGSVTQTSAGTASISFRPNRLASDGRIHLHIWEPDLAGSTYTTQIFGSLVPISSVGDGTLLAGPFSGARTYVNVQQLPYMRIDIVVTTPADGDGIYQLLMMEP